MKNVVDLVQIEAKDDGLHISQKINIRKEIAERLANDDDFRKSIENYLSLQMTNAMLNFFKEEFVKYMEGKKR